LIACNLSKPESALDQVKKHYPKLAQTDAALIATALVLSGRQAKAARGGTEYEWPDEQQKLFDSLVSEVHIIQETVDSSTKKATKAAAEDEPVDINVGLVPNYGVGERMLGDREDLKTLFSDILASGVEFTYSPTDIGWQWALDRANWHTLSERELLRRVKFKATFEGVSTGIEMGSGTAKKRAAKPKAAPVPEPEAEPIVVEPTVEEV